MEWEDDFKDFDREKMEELAMKEYYANWKADPKAKGRYMECYSKLRLNFMKKISRQDIIDMVKYFQESKGRGNRPQLTKDEIIEVRILPIEYNLYYIVLLETDAYYENGVVFIYDGFKIVMVNNATAYIGDLWEQED